MTEAERRIREALADEALYDEGASVSDTLYAAHVFEEACSPENITALLADHAEREAALRAEVERLKAAIDMQPSPPTREDMDWAGKVHLAEAEKENDALRAEVEALRADAERLNFVEQTFIEEGSGLELYPFGVDEQYAEDGNTVIDRKFVFGGNGRVGPTLRAAIDAALAQAKDVKAKEG